MSKPQILIQDMKQELAKLLTKYNYGRQSQIYEPKTLNNSVYLKTMFQSFNNRYPFLSCGWDNHIIELFINKDMIRPFLKTSYMAPILQRKGDAYARSLICQYIWHEYGHSISFHSCQESMRISVPYTQHIPSPYLISIFVDFWADYQVKNKLDLFPGKFQLYKIDRQIINEDL